MAMTEGVMSQCSQRFHSALSALWASHPKSPSSLLSDRQSRAEQLLILCLKALVLLPGVEMVKTGGALILTRLTSERLGKVAAISRDSARKILMLPMLTAKTTTTPKTTTTTIRRKTTHRDAATPRGDTLPKKRRRPNPGRPGRGVPRRRNAAPPKTPQLRAHLMRGCKPVPLPSPQAVRVANRESRLALSQAEAGVERRTPKPSAGDGGNQAAKGSRILHSLQRLRGRLLRQTLPRGSSSGSSSSGGEESHDDAPAPHPSPNVSLGRPTPTTRLARARRPPSMSGRSSSELDISTRRTPMSMRRSGSQTVLDLSLVPLSDGRLLAEPQPQPARTRTRARTRQPSHVRRCSQCRRQTGQWSRRLELAEL